MTYYEDFLEIKGIVPEEPGLSAEDMDQMAEHVELVADGVIDTIDGNEHYSLTDAQRYLQGAMYASGMIPQTVNGNESVLSAVKDGLTKALKYVKELFQKIWNFLFKKKEPEQQVKETLLVITNTEKVINTVEFKEKMKIIEIGDKLKARGNAIQEIFNQCDALAENTEKKLIASKIKEFEPGIFSSFEQVKDKLVTKTSLDSINDPKAAVRIAKTITDNAEKLITKLKGSTEQYERKMKIFEAMIEGGLPEERKVTKGTDVTIKESIAGLKTWIVFISHLCALNTRLLKETKGMCEFIAKHK